MAYHIAISGANVDASSIRLDWEFYYEGVPDYTVYNQYLPKLGQSSTSVAKDISEVSTVVLKNGAITTASGVED